MSRLPELDTLAVNITRFLICHCAQLNKKYTYSFAIVSVQKHEVSGFFKSKLNVVTVFVHSGLHALPEPTRSALVPVRFVHDTGALALRLAHVLPVPTYRPLNKTRQNMLKHNFKAIRYIILH